MAKFKLYYDLVVCVEIEAASIEVALESAYDNVPYPEISGNVVSADCSDVRTEH